MLSQTVFVVKLPGVVSGFLCGSYTNCDGNICEKPWARGLCLWILALYIQDKTPGKKRKLEISSDSQMRRGQICPPSCIQFVKIAHSGKG